MWLVFAITLIAFGGYALYNEMEKKKLREETKSNHRYYQTTIEELKAEKERQSFDAQKTKQKNDINKWKRREEEEIEEVDAEDLQDDMTPRVANSESHQRGRIYGYEEELETFADSSKNPPEKTPDKRYEYISLQAYSDWEWLNSSKKKYRKVFESSEVDYLYFEFAFHNLQFRRSDWKANIKYRCFEYFDNDVFGKEMFVVEFDKTISSETPIFYLRESWGHKTKGHFWKKNRYAIYAYIDDILVKGEFFYVNEGNNRRKAITPKENPYFHLNSIQLFESPDPVVDKHLRDYDTVFEANKSRYIYTEIDFQNIQRKRWWAEFVSIIYTELGEIKGKVAYNYMIEPSDIHKTVQFGWGSSDGRNWPAGNYTWRIIFMDRILSEIPFECV